MENGKWEKIEDKREKEKKCQCREKGKNKVEKRRFSKIIF